MLLSIESFKRVENFFWSLNESGLDRPEDISVTVRFPTVLMDRKYASLTFSVQTDCHCPFN